MGMAVESTSQERIIVESTQAKYRGKGKSAAQKDALFSTALNTATDTATISEAAKDKARAASEDTVATYGNGQYKNETHALKAALQQISEETGTPIRGWALGHYRKAFRESGADDMAAVRDIFHNKYGIQKTEDAGETPVSPPIDPAESVEPPVELAEGTPGGEPSLEDTINRAPGNTDDDTVAENQTGTAQAPGEGALANEKTSQDEDLFALLDNL